ncbi:hypothetical protein D3C74_434200 [compost metagenome]
MRQCSLSQEKVRKNIGLKGLVQLLFRDIQNAPLRILYSKIVDQNIQPAKGTHRLLHRLEAVLSIT